MDPRFERYLQEPDRIQAFLRERGLPTELAKGEIPFAVFWPTRSADANSLRALGEQLRTWQARTPGVRRILGLERLLAGESPEVAVLLLMIPFSPASPVSWVERVALVVVDESANRDEVADSLGELIERSGCAIMTSWEQYSAMNR